ncbi:hypothetical protein BN1723_011830 [Verticillium longisporum]|uniref:EGF-like domain-containing protein n=1 Tax=Verticillium longisporum TaxID=100787 RepID=A0A0G4LB87_VERLO|nr:hypothetical protein BN1723_011830 [Verticillium longisporum]
MKRSLTFLILSLAGLCLGKKSCRSEDDCSLNGVCSCNMGCVCDSGWRGVDCSELDLQPVERYTGYNYTNITMDYYYRDGGGNSSWGGHIIQDREDKKLFHLVIAQFPYGCGLSAWRPFSTVIRAESRTGPRGPYHFAQELFSTFHHNPTTIWSPADEMYLMFFIGFPWEVPDTCKSTKRNNTISVSSSPDLRTWGESYPLVVNVTNPAGWPLWTPENPTSEILLAAEKNNIYHSDRWNGPYELEVEPGNIEVHPSLRSEDPFLWRDKRGHWHILQHHMIDIPEAKGPHLLNTMLANAHVVLQLSTREGFEVKVSEALHAGRPVIATLAGGIPLQVKDKVNGFLVEPGDWQAVAGYLFDLFTDDELHQKMSHAAATGVSDEVGTVGNALGWYYLASKWAEVGVKPGLRGDRKWVNDMAREEAGKPYADGENRLPRHFTQEPNLPSVEGESVQA